MKLLLTLLILAYASAQLTLNAYILLEGKDRPALTKITGGDASSIFYGNPKKALPLSGVEAYKVIQPKEFESAYALLQKGEYATALDQYKSLMATYKDFEQLPGSPASLSAYYATFCAIQLNKLDEVPTLSAKLTEDLIKKVGIKDSVQNLNIWNDIATKKWSRIPSKLTRLKTTGISDFALSEIHYIKALSLLNSKKTEEAKKELYLSLANGTSGHLAYERLALAKLLEIIAQNSTFTASEKSNFLGLASLYQSLYGEFKLPLPTQARLREQGFDI